MSNRLKKQQIPPSRPRFHALIWGQITSLIIVIAGMFFYWARFDKAVSVPPNISWRFVAIVAVILMSILIPQLLNSNTLKQLVGTVIDDSQPLADNPKTVRWFLWTYSFGNLLLLSYVVHITGGLTGSMFASTYLMLPSVPLFLRGNSRDTKILIWFVVCCALGILLAFLMSHYKWYEFFAADQKYEHVYDISIMAVSMLSFTIPITQIAILRYQEQKVYKGSRVK